MKNRFTESLPLSGMISKQRNSYQVACKWLSLGIVALFIYYWVSSFLLAFFYSPVSSVIPRHTFFFRTFSRQNWRLFAVTKTYNRRMLFIIRDKNDPAAADTTDMVQYFMAERRKHAPFDNTEDALERILYSEMNSVEARLVVKRKELSEMYPGNTDTFYQRQAIQFIANDSLHQRNINNIIGYGKYIMSQEKKDPAGKEYQIIMTHKYIAPPGSSDPVIESGNETIVFISSYKPF